MKKPAFVLGLTALAFVGGTPAFAADEPLGKDLKVTIVLHGQPCDQIVSTKRNADSD